jgi:integrase
MGKRSLNRLTALMVQRLKVPGYYPDGGNLYLRVSEAGTKSWSFIFTRHGKTREMGLGVFPVVTLEGAREKALEARRMIQAGEDPIDKRQANKAAQQLSEAKRITFEKAAAQYIESHRAGWKNEKHASQWETTLMTYAYPHFGKLPVSDVDTGLVMKALEPIWQAKAETASRLRGRIEAVLDWATTRGYRQGDNPARWRGHLENLLPARNKVAKVQHHPALPYQQMGAFMADLRKQDGMAARALEFAILTAARSGEVRGATWAEIDLEARVWTIPAERMKAGKEHRVPLSDEAVKLLTPLADLAGNDLVFPGARESKPLSDMSPTAVLRRMERQDITVHGFRSTFRDWAGETTAYPREVIEHALAHQLKDKAEAAYARGSLFDKRRSLMQAWAAFCKTVAKSAKVTPIRAGKEKHHAA